MSNDLKIKTRLLIFWGIAVFFILDLLLVKSPSHMAIVGLLRGEKFDAVSAWGISAIVHLAFMILQVFALALFNKKRIFAKKATLAYIISTMVFYSFLLYGSITGGAIMVFLGTFLRNTIMFAFSAVLFVLTFTTRKIVFPKA